MITQTRITSYQPAPSTRPMRHRRLRGAVAPIGLTLIALAQLPAAASPSAPVVVGQEPPAVAEALMYPHVTLSNGRVRMTVLLPDIQNGYYRGTRFDWAGLVASAEWNGHTFFGPWKATHDPLGHDDVSGPVEEFGMVDPPGYQDAKPGTAFLKIGVGLLVKEDDTPYQFFHAYRLQTAGVRTVSRGPDWIEFTQSLRDVSGWGYRYTKRIRLTSQGAGFVVSHRLQNTGVRSIDTQVYCHNFLRVDGRPVGPEYTLTFPFTPRPQQGLGDGARVDGRQVEFVRPLGPQGVVYAEFTGFPAAVTSNGASALNTSTGAGIAFHGDRAPVAYHLYCAGTALCPEPFVRLSLPPGSEQTWQTNYAFFAAQPDRLHTALPARPLHVRRTGEHQGVNGMPCLCGRSRYQTLRTPYGLNATSGVTIARPPSIAVAAMVRSNGSVW